jgi:PAS domain S-box-containing protein
LRAKVSVFADLFRKTEALERLSQHLEQRVQQRTAALSETSEKLARAYEASRLLASIVESSDDAIIGQSLNGIIGTWNQGAERLYGFKADEILGRSINELTPPDRIDEESRILEKLRKGERVDHFETVRLRKDRALVEVSLTISPIRDEIGEIIATSQVARDITEQKRTMELMRQTQKLESLGILAGGIAHDFNNLLVGILGNASLALDLLPPDSPGRRPLQGVVVAGRKPLHSRGRCWRIRVEGTSCWTELICPAICGERSRSSRRRSPGLSNCDWIWRRIFRRLRRTQRRCSSS